MSDKFQGTIRDISAQGLGVVDHPDGRVFFVRGGWPGDQGEFMIESVEKRYGFARISHLERASADRTDIPCVHSGTGMGECGGCPWMGIQYDKQLEQKQKMIAYLLKRMGAESEGVTQLKPILPSSKIFGYRNRAEFKTDSERIGYVSPGTRSLAPINNCIIVSEKNQQLFRQIKAQLPRKDWLPSEGYLWNFIQIDEWMVIDDVKLNKRRPFRQANSQQNEMMREWLREKLKSENRETCVVELFCGSGNFTKVLVEEGFRNIHAVEGVEVSIQKLREKNWIGVRGYVANLFSPSDWKKVLPHCLDAEVLILDPPRDGFKRLHEFIKKFKRLRRILYISCETSQMASEIREIKKYGWVLKDIQPVDQFPHTPHIETLSEIVREKCRNPAVE
ncbi:MAG: hypothetical protein K2Q26_09645 [Bdellovibrionales bacterium]|nr:hypothetical protein [Bdellovibrionales bacterium]